MTTSAIYDVLDALAEQLPTPVAAAVDGCQVYDGYPTTDDPGLAYLCVGVPDPNDQDAADSATSQQTWAHANHTARDETGDVWCVAVYNDPDGVPAVARAGAKAITAAVEDHLRENYALDVPTLLWTGYGESTTLQQDQSQSGAVAQVVFSIRFRARI